LQSIEPNIQAMSYISALNPNDVLQGRGAASDRNEGNIRFRALVAQRRAEYHAATQKETKARIGQEIVAAVHEVGGRFVRKVDSVSEAESLGIPLGMQAWLPIGEAAVLEKVKQALRDGRSRELQMRQAQACGHSNESTVTTRSPHFQEARLPPAQLVLPIAAAGCLDDGLSTSGQRLPTGIPTASVQGPAASLFTERTYQLERHQQQELMSPQSLFSQLAPTVHTPTSTFALPAMAQTLSRPLHVEQFAASPPLAAPLNSQLAFSHAQYVQDLQRQLAAVLASGPTQASVEDISVACRLSSSWRDIPETYQTFFPVADQQLGPHFTSKDLRVLLLTKALAEANGEASCLGRIRAVLATVQQLPDDRLRLSAIEVQSMAAVVQSISAMLYGET
jgi:hypothetical protein